MLRGLGEKQNEGTVTGYGVDFRGSQPFSCFSRPTKGRSLYES